MPESSRESAMSELDRKSIVRFMAMRKRTQRMCGLLLCDKPIAAVL